MVIVHTKTGDVTLEEVINELDSTECPDTGVEKEAREAAIKYIKEWMNIHEILESRE